jgi:hypothetical protein
MTKLAAAIPRGSVPSLKYASQITAKLAVAQANTWNGLRMSEVNLRRRILEARYSTGVR